jgi:hypothetical protein
MQLGYFSYMTFTNHWLFLEKKIYSCDFWFMEIFGLLHLGSFYVHGRDARVHGNQQIWLCSTVEGLAAGGVSPIHPS